MANKLIIPARAGAGSATHPTLQVSIPQWRNPKLSGAGTTVSESLTEGQGFPRKT